MPSMTYTNRYYQAIELDCRRKMGDVMTSIQDQFVLAEIINRCENVTSATDPTVRAMYASQLNVLVCAARAKGLLPQSIL